MQGQFTDRRSSAGPGSMELDRMAAMLSRLGGRGYNVREYPGTYRLKDVDFDPDSDFDFDPDFEEEGGQPDASHRPGAADAAPGR